MTGALSPLRHGEFRWFVSAATINTLGASIGPVALAFGVLDLTGSADSLGIVLAARSVTSLVWMLAGGVLADRMSRTVVLVGSSAVSAMTQAGVAAVLFTKTDSVALLAVLAAVNGLSSAFSGPAEAGLMPQAVPASDLNRANALNRLGSNGAATAGLALGGVIAATLGPGWGLIIDAATYAVAAACFAAMRVGRSGVVRYESTVVSELAEGWRAVRSRTWLWVTVAVFCVGNLVYFGGLTVLGPLIADQTFGRSKWGIVLASQTIGYVLGGLIALRTNFSRKLFFGTVCCLPMAAPLIALGFRAPFAVLVLVSFVAGVGVEQLSVAWQTCMQHHVPERLLSRVSSYDNLGSFIALPVGEASAGPISHAIGTGATLVGGGILLGAVVVAASLHPSVRTLRTCSTSEIRL